MRPDVRSRADVRAPFVRPGIGSPSRAPVGSTADPRDDRPRSNDARRRRGDVRRSITGRRITVAPGGEPLVGPSVAVARLEDPRPGVPPAPLGLPGEAIGYRPVEGYMPSEGSPPGTPAASLRGARTDGTIERDAAIAERDIGVIPDHEMIEDLDVEQTPGSEGLGRQVEVVRTRGRVA